MSSGTPRTFYVPDPPQIPSSDPPQHWSKISSNWTAHLKSDKTGFDVRPIDPNDPTGCKLGPPSNAPDYNVLLEKYGMQVLAASGFLNHTGAKMSEEIYGRLAFADFRNPTHEETLKIHPVLRPNMWGKTTPQVYAMIMPVLRLVTAVLDDPVTLSYYHALSSPSDLMDTRVYTFPDGIETECKTMDVPDTLSEAEQRAVYDKMCEMRRWTSWKFETNSNEDWHAIVRPRKASEHDAADYLAASVPGTKQSDISIKRYFLSGLNLIAAHQQSSGHDERYMQAFVDAFTMAGITAEKRAKVSLVSAMYRTTLFLAEVMLHEFAHAFSFAYYETHKSFYAPNDPWVRGNRSNEQGHSFVNHIFGGVFRPITVSSMRDEFEDIQYAIAPCGFFTTKTWDVWDYHDEDERQPYDVMEVGNADSYSSPMPDDIKYPVPQEWTEYMFTKDAWESDVARFGMNAIKIPKPAEWQIAEHDTEAWTDDEVKNRPRWD
ncbi:hypothetical protein D6C97_06265 [Aureobasidium pullulans]|nr:hypothetical protein D6C97_06265 [Aureobasidium pullulans]